MQKRKKNQGKEEKGLFSTEIPATLEGKGVGLGQGKAPGTGCVVSGRLKPDSGLQFCFCKMRGAPLAF